MSRHIVWNIRIGGDSNAVVVFAVLDCLHAIVTNAASAEAFEWTNAIDENSSILSASGFQKQVVGNNGRRANWR